MAAPKYDTYRDEAVLSQIDELAQGVTQANLVLHELQDALPGIAPHVPFSKFLDIFSDLGILGNDIVMLHDNICQRDARATISIIYGVHSGLLLLDLKQLIANGTKVNIGPQSIKEQMRYLLQTWGMAQRLINPDGHPSSPLSDPSGPLEPDCG